MNTALRIAFHPLTIIIAALAFLGTGLADKLGLPPTVTYPFMLAVSMLTLASAWLPAFHADLAVSLSRDSFHMVITVLTVLGLLVNLLGASLATSPYHLPVLFFACLNLLVGLLSTIANQLQASADESPAAAPVAPPHG